MAPKTNLQYGAAVAWRKGRKKQKEAWFGPYVKKRIYNISQEPINLS